MQHTCLILTELRPSAQNKKKSGALSPSHRTFSIWPPISRQRPRLYESVTTKLVRLNDGASSSSGQAPVLLSTPQVQTTSALKLSNDRANHNQSWERR